MSVPKRITPQKAKRRLGEPDEVAFIDVREFGQYGEGHPFFAVNRPYSRLEGEIGEAVPRKTAPMILLDDGDDVADRAAERLIALGYTDVMVLEGGAPGWTAAGYRLFKGVNLPSKAFGELVEETRHTPRISPEDLAAKQAKDDALLLLDGRTPAEHRRFTVPGAMSCPNGELGLRAPGAVDPDATIVVHCAGRTRSIIGAETLRLLGVKNPVLALENGTQGWQLAGYEREQGADRRLAPMITPDMRAEALARSAELCEREGIPRIDAAMLARWRVDPERTTYLLDVRTPEECEAATVAGAVHAPGGQLVQATDHWLAVRGARVVLWDNYGIRAATSAYWLRRMGWDAAVLTGPVETAPRATSPSKTEPVDEEAVAKAIQAGAQIVDVRSSAAYRLAHLDGAAWSIRPRLSRLPDITGGRFVVVAETDGAGALAAQELRDLGAAEALVHLGRPQGWREARLSVIASPEDPPDSERIDHLFFVAERHAGDLDQARAYLAWELGLPAQLDEQERAVFRPEA